MNKSQVKSKKMKRIPRNMYTGQLDGNLLEHENVVKKLFNYFNYY